MTGASGQPGDRAHALTPWKRAVLVVVMVMIPVALVIAIAVLGFEHGLAVFFLAGVPLAFGGMLLPIWWAFKQGRSGGQ